MAVAFPKTLAHTLFEHSLTTAEETWEGERRTQELHVDRHPPPPKKKLANTLKVSRRLFLYPTHSKPGKKGGREVI